MVAGQTVSSVEDNDNSKGEPSWIGGIVDDFFGIDLRTLAAVRIGLAIVVLWTLAYLVGDIDVWLTDGGVYPVGEGSEFAEFVFQFSLHALRGEYGWQLLLFGVHAGCAAMLLVGYRTRFASVATWLLTVSLFNRIHMTGHRADTLLCLLLLWGALTPWGARASLDAIRHQGEQLQERVVSLATAGLILQMPIVYVVTCVAKLRHSAWTEEFSGVHYALFPEYVTAFGAWVAALQPYVVSQILSVATLILQGLGPILIFCPLLVVTSSATRRRWLARLRHGAFAAYAGFHLVLLATVKVGLFPVISVVGLLPVISTSFWNRVDWPSFVERFRRAFQQRCRRLVAQRQKPLRVEASIATEAVALLVGLLSVVSVAENLRAYSLASEVRTFQRSVHILQDWAMFHGPPRGVSYFVARGELADGRSVDLFADGGPVKIDDAGPVDWNRPRPERSSSHYAGYRWRLLMWTMTTYNPPEAEYERVARHNYLGYLCRRWNDEYDGDEKLEAVTLYHLFFSAEPPPQLPESTPEREAMARRDCPVYTR